MNCTRRQLLRSLPVSVGAGLTGCNTIGGGEETSNGTETSRTTVAKTSKTRVADRAREAPTPTAKTQTAPGELETTPTDASDRGSHTVEMLTELYFDPVGLFVEPGETVSFENVSGTHSATAFHPEIETYSIAPKQRIPKDAPPWNTGMVNEAGAIRNVTFETVGTYDYFCIPHVHTGMVGRIVVGEAGGPATNDSNPYTSYYSLPDSEQIVNEKTVPFDAVAPE